MTKFLLILTLGWAFTIKQAFATAPMKELGQLFIISLEKSYTPQDLRELIKTYCPGGFVLFKRNLPSLIVAKKVTSSIKKFSVEHCNSTPLIALDQEGGTVTRLPLDYQMPSAMAVGLSQSDELAFEYGQLVGKQLNDLGFNVNFAPVLDIASGEGGDFIYTRAFGSNPDLVASLGTAYSRGLISAGVVPTAKHFPGIGDAKLDLHKTTGANNETWSRLLTTRLKPFNEFAKLGPITLVMTSHLSFPELDKSGMPSGFSRVITTDLLKDFMGYKGLVITDDLEMNGAHVFDSQQNGLVKAFYAGTDMLVFSKFGEQQKTLFSNFQKSFTQKVLDISVLKERVAKVNNFKSNLPTSVSRNLAAQLDLKEAFGDFNQRLLKKIFKNQITKLPKNISRFLVVSDESVFAKDLAEEFAGDVVHLEFQNVDKQLKRNSKLREATLLIPVYRQSDLKKAQSLPSHLLQRAIALNFMGPLKAKSVGKFGSVINVHFGEKKAGQELARFINESEN